LILSLLALVALAVVGHRIRSRPKWDEFDPAKLPGAWTVVAFSSDGCYACVEQQKVFAQLKPEYDEGQVRLWQVDVYKAYDRAVAYGIPIRVVPTLVFFDPDGEIVRIHEGYLLAQEIRDVLAVFRGTI